MSAAEAYDHFVDAVMAGILQTVSISFSVFAVSVVAVLYAALVATTVSFPFMAMWCLWTKVRNQS